MRGQPDFVGLIRRIIEGRIKIDIVFIEIKRNREKFHHKLKKEGYGVGQSIRDSRWFILKTIDRVKQSFPEVSVNDIDVSCYILTASMENGKSYLDQC